jgi:lipopolysaccharide export system protein LptC
VVTLNQDVVVTSSSGTEIRLIEARLDMRKGHVLSNKPVEVLLPNGRIDAKQMEVIEGGDVVQFRGGVTMLVNPDSVQTSAAGSQR